MSFAKKKVRLRILKGAGELFLTQGYSKTRMEDFVNIIGISKNSLYRNFASKEEVLRGASVYRLGRQARKIRRIRERKNLGFSERIKQIYRELIGLPHSNCYGLLSEVRDQIPDIWRYIQENRAKSVEEEIRKLLQEGKDLGEFREDLKPELLIMAMSACSEALFGPETPLKNGEKRSETLSELDNMLLYGIIQERKKADGIGLGDRKIVSQEKREGI